MKDVCHHSSTHPLFATSSYPPTLTAQSRTVPARASNIFPRTRILTAATLVLLQVVPQPRRLARPFPHPLHSQGRAILQSISSTVPLPLPLPLPLLLTNHRQRKTSCPPRPMNCCQHREAASSASDSGTSPGHARPSKHNLTLSTPAKHRSSPFRRVTRHACSAYALANWSARSPRRSRAYFLQTTRTRMSCHTKIGRHSTLTMFRGGSTRSTFMLMMVMAKEVSSWRYIG